RAGDRMRGSLAGDAGIDGVAARLAGRFALDDKQLALDGLRLEAGGASLAGTLQVALPSTLTDGSLVLAAPDLATLSRLAGTPLGGRLQGRLQLAGTRGAQQATLALEATGLRAGDARVASAKLDASLSDLT